MRHMNPHMQMPQQMVQQMQQPMQQQFPMQQQGISPQQAIAMGIPPQLVAQWQQQMAAQYTQQMQGQYPQQQFNQPTINTGRFTQGNNQQFEQVQDTSGRFSNMNLHQEQTQMQQQVVEDSNSTLPIPFTVKPINTKIGLNESVKLGTFTNPINKNDIQYLDKLISTDLVEEIIETIVEEAYATEETKTLTLSKYLVCTSFYKINEKINKTINELFSGDIKAFYKGMKSLYKAAKDKYEVTLLNGLDTIVTDYINDFIAVKSTNSIYIESFISDFNDLLKVIRNSEEELEDDLIDYLTSLINSFNENNSLMNKNEGNKQFPETVCNLYESFTIAYLDKHEVETGLSGVYKRFVALEQSVTNAFLLSIAAQVNDLTNSSEFLLVTLDRTVFKVMMYDEKVFIKLHM